MRCDVLHTALKTFPQELGTGVPYSSKTGLYCMIGWIGQCGEDAGIREDTYRSTDPSGNRFYEIAKQVFGGDDVFACRVSETFIQANDQFKGTSEKQALAMKRMLATFIKENCPSRLARLPLIGRVFGTRLRAGVR